MSFLHFIGQRLLITSVASTPYILSLHENNNNYFDYIEKIEKAKDIVKRNMAVQGIPGLSIAVTVNGRIIWKDGFGYANLETASKCTGESVMRIASISKPITSVISARLFEKGKIDLDANIRNYVPDFPIKKINNEEVNITLRQLLSHSAGIRHYKKTKQNSSTLLEHPRNNNTEEEEFLSNRFYPTNTDALEIFKNDDLVSKPGSKFSYTTYGLTLVGAALEKVSGKTYEQLASKLFSDLGMRNTHLDYKKRIIKSRVSYYRRNRHHILENCPEVDSSYKYPGGGLLSNVTDLLIFANAILYSSQADSNDSLLKKETMTTFLSPQLPVDKKTSSGLGWFIVRGGDVKTIEGNWSTKPFFYHTGAAVGASSVLLIRPNNSSPDKKPSGVCVAVLCNVQDISVLPLALDIADLFQTNTCLYLPEEVQSHEKLRK